MTELSPSAQAVLNAAEDAYGNNYSEFYCCANSVAAAVLRAAADQPYEVPPWYRGDDYWTYRNGVDAERNQLLAIAAELEAV